MNLLLMRFNRFRLYIRFGELPDTKRARSR